MMAKNEFAIRVCNNRKAICPLGSPVRRLACEQETASQAYSAAGAFLARPSMMSLAAVSPSMSSS